MHAKIDGWASLFFNWRPLLPLGIAGPVYMDRNGERDPDYVIQTLINDRFEDIAYYTRYNDNFTILPGVTIVWPGGVTTPPHDSPECGWDGELCNKDSGEQYKVRSFKPYSVLSLSFY